MISRTKALETAIKEAARLASTPAYAARHYKTAAFYRELETAFVFFAACPELLDLDYAPGGFFIYVDKANGHILTQTEIENLSRPVRRDVRQAA